MRIIVSQVCQSKWAAGLKFNHVRKEIEYLAGKVSSIGCCFVFCCVFVCISDALQQKSPNRKILAPTEKYWLEIIGA